MATRTLPRRRMRDEVAQLDDAIAAIEESQAEESRITWDTEERRQLVLHVTRARLRDPAASLSNLLRRAQAQLPKKRQREGLAASQVPWLAEDVAKEIRQLAGVEKRNESLEAQVADLEAKLEETGQFDMSRISTEDLLQELVGRLHTAAASLANLVEGFKNQLGSIEGGVWQNTTAKSGSTKNGRRVPR